MPDLHRKAVHCLQIRVISKRFYENTGEISAFPRIYFKNIIWFLEEIVLTEKKICAIMGTNV